ncbi:MAG: NAD(P)/FAD-dependent oxidoreductase [Gemmatimonadota bacterium]|nr:NAD(P)/FAD-dependent oxidoreductase [Gemmatimonadota bacterium]
MSAAAGAAPGGHAPRSPAARSTAGNGFDAVIVGAGHNGLVTAALLARAGRRVLVLERRGVVGGAAATEEVFPGCRVNLGAQDGGLFQPGIVSALGLEAHGLEWVHPPSLATSLTGGGDALTLWRDPDRTHGEIARHSRADAARFPEWTGYLRTMARALRIALDQPAPALHELTTRERLRLLRPLLQAGRLGKRHMVELLRVLPLPARDLLDDWFRSDALKGMLASSALPGADHGPSAMGGAFRMLYHAAGTDPHGFRSTAFVKGGIGALSQALASAARSNGAEVRTGAEVQQILVEDGAAMGVLLANGEEIAARCVVSGADPRRTFFELIGAPRLGPEFNRKVANIRMRGTTAVLHLLLDALPPLPDAAQRLAGHTLVAPTLDYLERASDDAKYGRCSARPHLDIVIPTLHDPTLAPEGRHLASIQIRYAPRELQNAPDLLQNAPALAQKAPDMPQNTPHLPQNAPVRSRSAGPTPESGDIAARSALLAGAHDTLDEYLPGLRDRILDHHLFTPLDLETELALTGGDEYHGRMTLDQLLFMRPIAGWARHRTPVKGLFLCGSGTHPGGGVTGAPGRLAAREILRDRG